MRTASRAEVPGHDPMPVARTGADGDLRVATAPVSRHGAHRSTSAVTDAGTGVPASTDHGDGSGAPATTRNGTTPDQASVSSSGTEARRSAP